MNFYIKKNSTLPKLSIDIFIDSGTDFRNSSNSFSSSTITFSMKDESTDVYKIIDKPVTIVKNYNNTDGPNNYTLQYQFTKKETLKTGSFIGEFKIHDENGTYYLPINEKIKISILDSFSNPDFCCRPNRGILVSPPPSESVRQTTTPTPTPSITPSVTPTPSISLTPSTTITPSVTLTPFLYLSNG